MVEDGAAMLAVHPSHVPRVHRAGNTSCVREISCDATRIHKARTAYCQTTPATTLSNRHGMAPDNTRKCGKRKMQQCGARVCNTKNPPSQLTVCRLVTYERRRNNGRRDARFCIMHQSARDANMSVMLHGCQELRKTNGGGLHLKEP